MKPRRLVHQGTVQAAAFWIDESIAGKAKVRRRILEIPGVEEVRRMEGGLFVRLQAPGWVACEHAPGVPLVACRDILLGAPLDSDELDELAAPSNVVVLVRGGETRIIAIESCPVEDLTSWIDLSEWNVDKVVPLGIIWSSPREAPQAKEIDPRQVAGIGPPPKEAEEFLAAFKEGRAPESATAPKGFASSLLTSISTFLSSIAARLGRQKQQTTPTTSSRSLVVAPTQKQPESDWTDRLRLALNMAAARFLIWARLASRVIQRQADYLEKTVEMFDEGNLEEALRHAIPLGTGSDNKPKPLAFGVPTPRADLSIHATKTEASSVLGFGGNVFEALRIRYRKAVEQLEKQGKIKEAAFVLAELLGASEEAVSFLEKHKEYQLAAELAEGRQLDPALVVRQWILAGNRDRAVLIARRTGAFAAAVAKLEQSHPEQAKMLRILWANQLAASGAYGAAVQTIWPVEAARHLARDWIDRGIAIGGIPGARLLATKAWLIPEEFASVAAVVRELPRNDSDDSIDMWTAMGQSVLANPSSKTMRILARACLRALLPHSNEANAKSLVDRLTTATDDPVLIADLRRQDRNAGPKGNVRLHVAALTDVGLARTVNEDGYVVSMAQEAAFAQGSALMDERPLPSGGALFAVADGTGGYHSAEVVDNMFQTLTAHFRTADKRPEKIGSSLAQAVEEAGAALFKTAAQDRRFAGSGATITAAWLFGDVLWIAQVGDTRAYLLRDGVLKQLTKDHSLLNELIEGNKLSPQEIESFPHKNVITRALGMVERVKVDLYRVPMLDGDRILLCTDGVHGLVEHEQMMEVLRRPHNDLRNGPQFAPKAACDVLKKKVYDAGAHDNLAMVVVDVRIQGAGVAHSRAVAAESIAIEEKTQPSGTSAPSAPERRVITREVTDTGTMEVHDAAVLPGGRLLVALGEAGVRMLSPEGKTLVHFDQPAERIVISDHGDRAIVVTRRGGSSRTARIDLIRRRAERWFDANLHDFANSFDGSIWFVTNEHGVYAIDALEEGFASIREFKEPGQYIAMGSRSPSAASFRVADDVWTIELPSFRLRRKRTLSTSEKGILRIAVALAPDGYAIAWLHDDRTAMYRPAVHLPNQEEWIPLTESAVPNGAPRTSIDDTGFIGAFHRHPGVGKGESEGQVLQVFHVREQRVMLEVRLMEAHAPRLRFQGANLVIASLCGRVLVINVEQGKVVREWRV